MVTVWNVYLSNIVDSAMSKYQELRGGSGEGFKASLKDEKPSAFVPEFGNQFSKHLPEEFRQP
jgi:hypothetical protein